ncbi:hypothetical protein ACQR16_05985 [Bradyrhizobium oligotrophicum]|uniref:hypothetical protein n=1 Tax=Bradyrhizobium oligotrophicum TaxID=44255 RepID=UPI003EBFD0AD
MTAVNIFGSAKHNTIVMVTDTASYDDAGFVRGFASKVRPVPEWSAAITGRGNSFGIDVATRELINRGGSFKELFAITSQELPLIVDQHRLDRPFELILTSFVAGRPAIFFIRTPGGNDSLGNGWPPYLFYPVGGSLIGPSAPGFIEPDPDDAPEVIAAKLEQIIKEQRQILAEDGYPRVGGSAELTVITPDRIEQRTLHTWCEDRIGFRMSPES